MSSCKPCSTPLALGTKLSAFDGEPFSNPSLYRSIIGALRYLCNTRPDISFVINRLSQFLSNPLDTHWSACKRVLRYLKGTNSLALVFRPSTQPLSLLGFSDSDWAGSLDDRKSTTGGCVLLGGNLVFWSSKKQTTVAHSSIEAEYRALAHMSTELLWIQSLITELKFKLPHTPILWCDNNGARSLAQNPVFHARTKHIEIDVHFIRDKVESGQLDVRYISSNDQLADLLTKPLSGIRLKFLLNKLNLCSLPELRLRGDVGEENIDGLSLECKTTKAHYNNGLVKPNLQKSRIL